MNYKGKIHIIAIFCGWAYYPDDTINNIKGVYRKEGKGSVLLEEMLYDTDWRWTMQAIQAICDGEHWSINAVFEMLSETQDRDGLYSIADVFEAIVEYIKIKL